MVLRIVDILIPADHLHRLEEALQDVPALDRWRQPLLGERTRVGVLLPAEETEKVLDMLDRKFSSLEGFRCSLITVEATVPRPEPEEAEVQEATAEKQPFRISRHELYEDVAAMTNLTWVYAALAALSTVVAAIGLLRNDVAIIIGAMVIAPFIGPNAALALAVTIGDLGLARRALLANLVGIAIAVVLSVGIGAVFGVDPAIPQIASRTRVEVRDIALALAAGAAGAVSFTTRLSSALVGVMVAVALIPPLVAFGMLLGAGHLMLAVAALELLVVYLIGINLAGVMTFFVQGIRPVTWWEAARARRATRAAVSLLILLLATLAVVILLSPRA